MHPSKFKFDIDQARKLVKGEFIIDEEEEKVILDIHDVMAGGYGNKSTLLGRKTLDDELRLEQFENAVKTIVN